MVLFSRFFAGMGLNSQVVCNEMKMIIYFQVGQPGCTHDSAALGRTRLIKHPELFFGPGQYLLGDSAYTLSLRMLVPYRNPHAQIEENAAFNLRFSSARVKIEHVMGLLKNRWASLRGLRTQVRLK